MNPLTLDKLTLAKEEMKGFKIPTAKEIKVQKEVGLEKKHKKIPDTSVIDHSIGGVAAAPSGSSFLQRRHQARRGLELRKEMT